MEWVKLFETIDKENSAQREEIIKKANEEASKIVSDAKKDADLLIKVVLDDINREIETRKKAKAMAEMKGVSFKLQKAKMEVLNDIFGNVGKKFDTFNGTEEYKSSFKKFFHEAEEALEEKDLIAVINPRDRSLLPTLQDKKIVVQEDKTIKGGLVLKSADSRKIIYNTLESRLERIKPYILPKIASMIF